MKMKINKDFYISSSILLYNINYTIEKFYIIEKFNARKLLYLRSKIKRNVLKIFYRIKNLVLYHSILLLWTHEHDCVLFLDFMWVFICTNIWIIHFSNILIRFKLGKCNMIYHIITKLFFFNIKLIIKIKSYFN